MLSLLVSTLSLPLPSIQPHGALPFIFGSPFMTETMHVLSLTMDVGMPSLAANSSLLQTTFSPLVPLATTLS